MTGEVVFVFKVNFSWINAFKCAFTGTLYTLYRHSVPGACFGLSKQGKTPAQQSLS
jgi:hypothetical protein